MLGAVFIANALPEFLWSNFPPIMTVVAEKYRIGEVAASLPIIGFSVGTVPSAGLAGCVIDRRGYQFSLHWGLAILASCAWLRMLEGPFWPLVLAQGGIGARVLLHRGIDLLVRGRLVRGAARGAGDRRLHGRAVLRPRLLDDREPAPGERLWLRGHAADHRGSRRSGARDRISLDQAAALPATEHEEVGLEPGPDAQPNAVLFFLISFLQQGVFSAVATALEVVWSKRGFSAEDAGLANGLFIFGGIAGSFLMPLLQERLLGGRMTLVICYLISLLLTYPLFIVSSTGLGNMIAVILGIFWLGSLPVSLTLLEKVAGADHAGSASSVYWAFASAGSVALVWLFNAVAESWSWQAAAVLMLLLLTINEAAPPSRCLPTLAPWNSRWTSPWRPASLPPVSGYSRNRLRAEPIAALVWLSACLAVPFGASAAVTAEDYARAARFLPSATDPLVTHSLTDVGWLAACAAKRHSSLKIPSRPLTRGGHIRTYGQSAPRWCAAD